MHAPEDDPTTTSDQFPQQSRAEAGASAGIPTDNFVQTAKRQTAAREARIDGLDPHRQSSRRGGGGEYWPLNGPNPASQVGKRRRSKASRWSRGGN
jgi:hypothetical protein